MQNRVYILQAHNKKDIISFELQGMKYQATFTKVHKGETKDVDEIEMTVP